MALHSRIQEMEHELGEPVEVFLPRMLKEAGSISELARRIGVSRQTAFKWLLRCGYQPADTTRHAVRWAERQSD